MHNIVWEENDMNHWKETWNKRDKEIKITDNIFDMFCKLKKADGYDTLIEDGYYEGMLEEWKRTNEEISRNGVSFNSVYEVGCGSGVNLYLSKNLLKVDKLGGIDYSKPLIEIARHVLADADLQYGEAVEMEIYPNYDFVLSEGVFVYFPDMQYGMHVLEKMFEKADKVVVVKDIYDLEKKDACMATRRASIENYDERYKGLEKTFYARELFIKFADEKKCKYKMIEPKNEHYWNNDFTFDFYLYK